MKSKRRTYIKNILIPSLVLSGITGVLTGALIFLFKVSASGVISLSESIYETVRNDFRYTPLLLAGAVLIALLAATILKFAPTCRGGGIPTSIAIVRGLIPFNWIKSIFLLFPSAMLTYLCGVPLGNEGPSVQMGTAVGRGAVRIFAKKDRAWDRYIMTGGACAGFAAATGAPLAGIFFAFEDAHRRFSPMIFITAAIAVITGDMTMAALCDAFSVEQAMFSFSISTVLPIRFIWTSFIVGLVSALAVVAFTKIYRFVFKLFDGKLARLPFTLKLVAVFVLVAVIGLVGAEFLGSGHDLVEMMLHGDGVWYMMILWICVRAILLILANNAGVTGGLFVPSLAFGAMIGALCGKAMTALGVLPEQYYVVLVVVGMASFLSAYSRIPITAIIFSVEALGGLSNILPIASGVTFAYLIIEAVGIPDFSDTVIATKVENETRGKTASVVETHLTVAEGAFIVGKEIRDILWPPTCVVLSVKKANGSHSHTVSAGDVLHVHYQTYDAAETMRLLEEIAGKQKRDVETISHDREKDDVIPET